MSAWVVSKHHIDVLVSALIEFDVYVRLGDGRPRPAKDLDPVAIGQMLWTENVRSVTARYDLATTQDKERQDEHAGYIDDIVGYAFTQRHGFKPGPLAHALACYEYQSCEHATWRDSAACEAVYDLYRALCRRLPGYDDGPWGVDTECDLMKVCSMPAQALPARRRK